MKRVFYILVILLICQCTSISKVDDYCKKLNQQSVDYIYNFQMEGDSTYLDSALVCINSALEKCKEQNELFIFRKLDVLSKKRDFSEAIYLVDSVNRPLFPRLPYYNAYLINRFKAMDYQLKGDLKNRNKCLKIITDDIQKFISLNEGKVDSLYHTTDIEEILRNPLHFTVIQFYYSKSIMQGSDFVMLELESLQSQKHINEDYFNLIGNTLKEDFMDFVGY